MSPSKKSKTTIEAEPSLPPQQKDIENLFQNWFLDYASYVILERAIPNLTDGLKPVQRRILHAMWEMDDGRFHKVANIIGQTMKYHPHGDGAIGEALVNLGQKNLLVDTQGNWGDIRTGDSAAASRYIESRLSYFSKEVLFHAENTQWQLSYDGRNREPITLPVKFPLILALGADGIAVGLATKILPHNFCELIDASIAILEGNQPTIYPDFPTGGEADCSDYRNGMRGGKIKVRAKIEKEKKGLIIREIPFGTTTTSLIDSILKANESGKIKIKKVSDNTAQNVAVYIELSSEVDTDQTIQALYAFTDCEISISPNCCVIDQEKPQFISVIDVLRRSTNNTVEMLKQELTIKLNKLEERWLTIYWEKTFIENRLHREIENCETWEHVLNVLFRKLQPFQQKNHRELTQDDVSKLTEIPIRKISKYSLVESEQNLKKVAKEIKEIKDSLKNIISYTIAYFQNLKAKYGQCRVRRTKITAVPFEEIHAARVALANVKLYANRNDGFIGYGLKKDEFIFECSDIDDIIVFLKDGRCRIVRIAEKVFVGNDIIFLSVWRKNEDTNYSLVFQDSTTKKIRAKRFSMSAGTRDKDYELTEGNKILYISEGAPEKIRIHFRSEGKKKYPPREYDLNDANGSRDNKGCLIHTPKATVLKIEVIPPETSNPTIIEKNPTQENSKENNDIEKNIYKEEYSANY